MFHYQDSNIRIFSR